eukprot:CAMPEP_0198729168 /NCGR_PEP_ID=MMETSP1475-20131203/15145_1 /TAXON_ID= ORGANISM="Unidentified sp., Strain CCMP1999" /NCGR_SAMPLE_ID=MMETSP1475 /ASSEMBLY_ACC=CAM_ASM_001111 /LENGTH=78 /DNA_ID=CAMNT_0044491743 /DNA_START=884 /DNA_END=1117 /DNA_ORIENTATION=+
MDVLACAAASSLSPRACCRPIPLGTDRSASRAAPLEDCRSEPCSDRHANTLTAGKNAISSPTLRLPAASALIFALSPP